MGRTTPNPERRALLGRILLWWRATPIPVRWALLGVVGLLLFLGSLVDRGPRLPPTYPVKGKVVFKGGKPWKGGGLITFYLASDPRVIADGTIQPDGTFTLTTKMYGKAKPGAAAGEHRVTVEEGSTAAQDGQRPIRPIDVRKTCQVMPGENNLTIEVVR